MGMLPPPSDAEPSALVERVRASVVTLEARDVRGHLRGNGTGFLISEDGLVVTNDHVVEMAPSVAVFADGSTRAVLGLLATDAEADVAILRIEGEGYPWLKLGAPVPPAVGDAVMVIGSPLGLEQTVTTGAISALRPNGLGAVPGQGDVAQTAIIQITANVAPGSSGSPVLSADGSVIGVAQSANELSDLYFAVDIGAVRDLLDDTPADAAIQPLDSPLRQLLLTLGLVGFVLLTLATPTLWRSAGEALRVRAKRRAAARARAATPPTRFTPR